MIPVTPMQEPKGFDVYVRRPGKNVLARVPLPKAKEMDPLWKWAMADLYAAYKRTCAYTCMYIPMQSIGSIDHFVPRSVDPKLAYEWSNLRLAIQRVNSHKGNAVGLIDPFEIQPGWFVLDFPSCLIKAGDNLPNDLRARIEHTINCLKLNDDDSFVQERCDIMYDFAHGDIAFGFLERRYPFLALEVRRQNLEQTAHLLFKRLH